VPWSDHNALAKHTEGVGVLKLVHQHMTEALGNDEVKRRVLSINSWDATVTHPKSSKTASVTSFFKW